ncbi:DUF4097 family beta strand repeat-containing protein [Glycomyces tritici]|uniref:Adhesin domain-containing protein n=1 Tax=Glycomyces tritici TaxID=2665176 RepID=A0ABT7YTM3_9ACTN|nr:hypothetical protein [Glycomyces tritici]MDN3241992.1 hypothetical protein [Glycomyces tritici]
MHTFDTPAPVTAVVDIVLGDIRFTAADRGTTVVDVAPIDPGRALDVEAAAKVNVEFEAGRLRVWQPKLRSAFARKFGSVRISVQLPTGSNVQGDTADGEYVVQGSVGTCRLKNAIGDIKVAEAAEVRLATSAGRIAVDRVHGSADISGSGDLRAARIGGEAAVKNIGGDTWIGEAGGDLRASSSQGPITVGVAHAGVRAKTAIGAISVGEALAGPIDLHAAVGRLEVGVPEGTDARLDAKTPTGLVRNESQHAGAARQIAVKARTSGGDVIIRNVTGSEQIQKAA